MNLYCLFSYRQEMCLRCILVFESSSIFISLACGGVSLSRLTLGFPKIFFHFCRSPAKVPGLEEPVPMPQMNFLAGIHFGFALTVFGSDHKHHPAFLIRKFQPQVRTSKLQLRTIGQSVPPEILGLGHAHYNPKARFLIDK